MNKNTIVVTCAIIQKNDRIFAAQRPLNKKHGGKWEFPGGKVGIGESLRDGLYRELKEELNIEVQVRTHLDAVTAEYEDFVIELHPFICDIANGLPTLLEHQQLGWYTLDELIQMDFTAADMELIERIKKAGGVPAIGEQR